MRKIKEVLRLKWEHGFSNRKIASSCSISRSTVAEHLRRAEEAGLSSPLPSELEEAELFFTTSLHFLYASFNVLL